MKKSKKIVIANWKMNPTSEKEVIDLFSEIRKEAIKLKNIETVVCPQFLHIKTLKEINKINTKVKVGSQDVSKKEKGSFTGEVSVNSLKDLGVEFVIVGHSERKELGDTHEEIFEKAKFVLEKKMNLVLCVGEKERYKTGEHLAIIAKQIESILKDISKKYFENIIIAYEPVWAIGGNEDYAIDSHSLHSMSLFIRKVLRENYGESLANKVKIIYGGSVEVGNAEDLIKNGDINGFLIGHSSLNSQKFNKILNIVDKR